MGRMNIHLDDTRDAKLQRLKEKFNIKSKEDVIMRLIDKFPEEEKVDDMFNTNIDTDTGDIL